MKNFINLLKFGLLLTTLSIKAQVIHHSHCPIKYTEALALKQIHDLPEVKSFYREFKKREKVDVEISAPDTTSKYYFIQVGLDRMGMFMSHFNFQIDPKTGEITYWDDMNQGDNTFITLRQWRKWRHDPRFQENHLFKNGKIVVLHYTVLHPH